MKVERRLDLKLYKQERKEAEVDPPAKLCTRRLKAWNELGQKEKSPSRVQNKFMERCTERKW